MVYSGFCVKQNKDYFVEFTQISVSSLEDKSPKSINGRLKCKYAGFTGCCNRASDCSILKNLSK